MLPSAWPIAEGEGRGEDRDYVAYGLLLRRSGNAFGQGDDPGDDQEGAPQVGSNPWTHHPQVACMPLALLHAGQADARDALDRRYAPAPAKQDLQD